MGWHEFLDRVVSFCDALGGSVSSWARTPDHSVAVGGTRTDPHVFKLGADVVYTPAPFPPLDRSHAAAAQLGLFLIREVDHDHLQPTGWVNPP
jgi:hypothetical protein